jgi:D-psicose/D-tagatose/L-ribulose 3-epimerase
MLGVNLLLWKLRVTADNRDLFELLRNTGYRLVEIPMFAIDEAECRALSNLCDELGLARTALAARGAEDNPLSTDQGIRRLAIEHSKADVDKASALGAKLMTGPFHGPFGVFTGSAPTRQEWAWAVEHMADVADHAHSKGVTLSVEFLNRFESYFLNSTEETARFVKDVGALNVGVLYDTFHANIEDPNIGPTLANHCKYINHVHVSESHRGTLGTGMVGWDQTFEALRQIEYSGHIVVEIFSPNVPELVPLGHLWRKTFDTEEQAATDAYAFVSERLEGMRKAA